MTHLEKLMLIIALNLAFIGCNKDDQDNDTKPTKQEIFISSTFDIFDNLTTTYFPKDDVTFRIFKDENGFLTAKYELRGKTKKEIQKGSFF